MGKKRKKFSNFYKKVKKLKLFFRSKSLRLNNYTIVFLFLFTYMVVSSVACRTLVTVLKDFRAVNNQGSLSFSLQDNTENYNWFGYINPMHKIRFKYPGNYTVSSNSDYCNFLVSNKSECLIAMKLSTNDSEFTPPAYFWLLKGIDQTVIFGQSVRILFDQKTGLWVVDEYGTLIGGIGLWGYTSSGLAIAKTSNGRSYGSHFYYLINNIEKDEVAIFAFPNSFRLRCDNYADDASMKKSCENFYDSITQKFYEDSAPLETWLPGPYLSDIYSKADEIVLSYGSY